MIYTHGFLPLCTDIPQAPQFIGDNITCFGVTNESAQCRIQWTEPANRDSFDLDHYQLTVGSDIMNIDAKENTVIISIQMGANITLGITAVDRCGMMSASNNTISFNSSVYMESIDEPYTNPTAVESINKSCGWSESVNAGFAILALLVATFFTWSIIATVLAIKQWKTKWNYSLNSEEAGILTV